MPEQLQNILWMGEEIDFNLRPEVKDEARFLIHQFLEMVANPQLSHRLY